MGGAHELRDDIAFAADVESIGRPVGEIHSCALLKSRCLVLAGDYIELLVYRWHVSYHARTSHCSCSRNQRLHKTLIASRYRSCEAFNIALHRYLCRTLCEFLKRVLYMWFAGERL